MPGHRLLIVDFGSQEAVLEAFEAAHKQRYGFVMEGKGHVISAVSVELILAPSLSIRRR